MKTKFCLLLILFLSITSILAQSSLNHYKYIIVPKKYDFLKDADQYQLNSLTKFLYEKYGFEALMEGDNYPEDLIKNRCLGLKSNLFKDSSLFKTKLMLDLKDCNDQIVYTSDAGESREKDYAKAYTMALRDAFKSFENLNYRYTPKVNDNTINEVTVDVKNEVVKEIQELKQEIQSLKKQNEVEVAVAVDTEPKAQNLKEVVNEVKPMNAGEHEVLSNVLYAQAMENGFQLVDRSPKVVYRIKGTGVNNVFLIENKSAIIYKKGDNWILEYYENNFLKQEELNIKF